MEAVADAKAQQSQLANPPQSNLASTLPLSISAGYTYEGGSQFTVEEEMGPEQLAQLAQLGIGPGMGSQLAVDMDSNLSEFADLSQLGVQLQQPQIDQLSQNATGMPGGLDLDGSMYPQDAFAASQNWMQHTAAGYGSDGGNYMDDEYGMVLDEGAELERDRSRQSDPAYRAMNAVGTTSTASAERDRDIKKSAAAAEALALLVGVITEDGEGLHEEAE
jgi:hypothetical protein